MKRIKSLSESPCYQCHCEWGCDEKIKRSPVLSDFDYHDCGIWIALNAPEMIEVYDE